MNYLRMMLFYQLVSHKVTGACRPSQTAVMIDIQGSMFLQIRGHKNSSVGPVTRLRTGRTMNRDQISGTGKRFFFFPKHTERFWGPLTLPFNGCWGSPSEVKRSRLEAEHSPQTEIKNVRKYKSTPRLFLHGVQREEITFTFT